MPSLSSSKPSRFWTITLAALLAVLIAISLGIWQLRRAEQKLSIASETASRAQLALLDNAALLASGTAAQTLHYRHAQLSGSWLAQHTHYLENRQMNARVGFFVVTPFQLAQSDKTLLVQRGWVPRNLLDRTQLPAIVTPEGAQQITVSITPPPGRLWDFDSAEAGLIRQNINLEKFANETKLALLPFSAQEIAGSNNAADGLLRQWPAISSGVDKHYGYAAQWFGLGALFAGLYVWFQWLLPKKLARTEQKLL
jgi:surfeit locus 1 family protein